MSPCLFYVLLFVGRVSLIQSSGNCTSRSLPAYSESSFNGGNFSTGGIQLLIPSSNFTCQGSITEWSAHVTGNTSIDGLIEFQIFEPDHVDDSLYHLVYGNIYRGDNNVQDSVITVPVGSGNNPFIPVREGYIVGVYLPPSVVGVLDLLYEDDGDTDVYYWENAGNRSCNYSLCSGKVKRNVNLLIGWEFLESSLSVIQSILDNILQDGPQYCQVQSMLTCINDVTSTLLVSIQSSSSSSITTTNTTMSITAPLSSTIATSMGIITTTSMSITAPLSSAFATIRMGIITTSSFYIITNTLSTSSLDTSVTSSSQLAPELIATIIMVIVAATLFIAIIVIIISCIIWLSRKPLNHAASPLKADHNTITTRKCDEIIEMFPNVLYNSVEASKNLHSDVPFESNPAYNAEIRSTNYITGRHNGGTIVDDGERIYSEVGDNSLHISSM